MFLCNLIFTHNSTIMKLYIELWKAKESWKNLSQEERGKYMDQLGPAIKQMLDNGVEIVSWGTNDASTFKRADYDFFGVWKFPSAEAAQQFEKMVEGAGWYTYFEQVNLMGDAASPQDIIPRMINM